MIADRKPRDAEETDKHEVAQLNKKKERLEMTHLENVYLYKRKFDKISHSKQLSLQKWTDTITGAAMTSTLLEPAEFKVFDRYGKRRSIKIGPRSSEHDVRRAIEMHDASKYDEEKKREIANWKRCKDKFGAAIRDIERRKARIFGFSSNDEYFHDCFEESALDSHTTPAHAVYHTSFRQPSPDSRLEKENSQLLERLHATQREVKEILEENTGLQYANHALAQDNAEISSSLKNTQDQIQQIAKNRDEHAQANRRLAEENKKLESEVNSAQEQGQSIWSGWGLNPGRKVAFADKNDRLEEEIDQLKNENESLSRSLATMKRDREPHDILRDIGIQIRLEFLQSSKAHEYPVVRNLSHHRIVSRSRPGLNYDYGAPDTVTGVGSPRGGNVRGDAALLVINSNYRAEFEQVFQEIYGVTFDEVKQGPNDKFAQASTMTKIVNLRGIMAHLGCFTDHTPNQSAEDEFMSLWQWCNAMYDDAVERYPTARQAAQTFSTNPEVLETYSNMRDICDAVVQKLKVYGRGPYMSGGL